MRAHIGVSGKRGCVYVYEITMKVNLDFVFGQGVVPFGRYWMHAPGSRQAAGDVAAANLIGGQQFSSTMRIRQLAKNPGVIFNAIKMRYGISGVALA